MAERQVLVQAVTPEGLRLRLLGSACAGCQGGCGGRCSLFATGADGDLLLPCPPGAVPRVGDQLRLRIDDVQLRRSAWRGYGLAWLGLVAGAAVGHGFGLLWPAASNLLTLAGLAAGTFLAVLSSKRHLPEPSLVPGTEHSPPPTHE
ncbi:SoxR reducing system RseC family protein [Arenimonas sp. MALMAid1274]|uniref:SoxR reducing system RseC family protein n=1 Tax=Arenimonas sp. MALMAid1274 TaxID=3411630 RepID=UPI003BA00C41